MYLDGAKSASYFTTIVVFIIHCGHSSFLMFSPVYLMLPQNLPGVIISLPSRQEEQETSGSSLETLMLPVQ